MKIELVTVSPAQSCAQAAAVCHNSKPTAKLLAEVINKGHISIMEFQDFVFLVTDVSRALTHQLVRHRIASYAQQSQRHVSIDSEADWYYVPDTIRDHCNKDVLLRYIGHMGQVSEVNGFLISWGIPLEDARYVLPNATYSTIMVKMNASSLQNFFRLRCCSRAQKEIRTMALKMLDLCRGNSPAMFKERYPACSECKEPCGEYNA